MDPLLHLFDSPGVPEFFEYLASLFRSEGLVLTQLIHPPTVIPYRWRSGDQLHIGQDAQQRVCAYLSSQGMPTVNVDVAGYDLDCAALGTIEVKFDRRAIETGNMAVEVGYTDGRKSGIWTTQAEWWATLITDGRLLMISIVDLRDYLQENAGTLRTVVAGAEKDQLIILLPMDETLKMSRLYRMEP